MARKYVDCREEPSESGCTLAMAGEEGELLEAAVQHAVQVHDEKDSKELRAALKQSMREEPVAWGTLHAEHAAHPH